MRRERCAKKWAIFLIGLLTTLPIAAKADSYSPELKAEEQKAQEEGFIPLGSNADREKNLSAIPIIRSGACLNILVPILNPEASIAAGMDALFSNNSVADRNCLETVVRDWDETPIGQLREAPPEEKALATLRKQKRKLLEQLSCYMTSAPCGKAISEAEVKSLRAELAKIEPEEWVLEVAVSVDTTLPEIAGKIIPLPQSPEIEDLEKKMECGRYAPTMPDYCGGKHLSVEEYVELGQQKALLAKKQKAEVDRTRDMIQVVGEMLGSEWAGEYVDLQNLRPLNKQLQCAQLDPNNGNLAARKFCERGGYSIGVDTSPIVAKIRAVLPDPEKASQMYQAALPTHRKKKEEETRVLKQAASGSYGIRRLLAHQANFAKRNPGSSLRDFCEANEKRQSGDLAFAQKLKNIRPFRSEEDWRWAQEQGLTESELTAVKNYTGSYFKEINPLIWKAKVPSNPVGLDSSAELFISTLNSALDLAPTFTEKPVRRFARLPGDIREAHQVGAIVTYDGFTSTSKKKDWNWSWAGDGADFFLIYGGKSGKNIEEISSNPREQEVLFKSGTRFKVLSRAPTDPKDPSKGISFVMAEVDEAGNVIAEVK